MAYVADIVDDSSHPSYVSALPLVGVNVEHPPSYPSVAVAASELKFSAPLSAHSFSVQLASGVEAIHFAQDRLQAVELVVYKPVPQPFFGLVLGFVVLHMKFPF